MRKGKERRKKERELRKGKEPRREGIGLPSTVVDSVLSYRARKVRMD